jgi:hypothetical protein
VPDAASVSGSPPGCASGCAVDRLGGLDPSTAEGFVDADHGVVDRGAELDELELGVEEVAVGVEDLDVGGVPAVEAFVGKIGVHGERLDAAGLGIDLFDERRPGDEGVLGFSERGQDREAEGVEELAFLRLGDVQLILEQARGEERAEEPGAERVGRRGRCEELCEVVARDAEGSGQREPRVEVGDGGADALVGGDEPQLGLAEVGAALEQVGREPGRDRGQRELVDGASACDRPRRSAQEHGEGVLEERDVALDGGDRRGGAFEFGADLRELELRDNPLVVLELEEIDDAAA